MATDRKPGEISSLTGLRGVAALLVIITRYWFWARVTPVAALPSSVEPWTATSDIGMAIFFTLSGFVIALSYSHWNWRDRPIFNLVRLFFYRFARAVPRILPVRDPDRAAHPVASRCIRSAGSKSYLSPHLSLPKTSSAWNSHRNELG